MHNAFLNGYLAEPVYMQQPQGFVDSLHPNYVCKLHRSLYGLKQTPRAWFSRLSAFLLNNNFTQSRNDTSLFIYNDSHTFLFVLVYVDDILITGNSGNSLSKLILDLGAEFSLKDLGTLHYFLGVEVERTPAGLLLSQTQYTKNIL